MVRISISEILCPGIQVQNANPPSGTCTKADLSYDTSCTFKCDPGFILQGNPVRRCQQDKTWSGSDNTCERKSSELPVPSLICLYALIKVMTTLFHLRYCLKTPGCDFY